MGKLSIKLHGKESSLWSSLPITKCFHHGGRRCNAQDHHQWKNVDFSNLLIGQKFSHGAHSQIYHGIYKDEHVAIKSVKLFRDDDDNNNDYEHGTLTSLLETYFLREVVHLSRLHHRNVVKFVAACKDPHYYLILTEYMQKGSLRVHLNKVEHKPISMKNVTSFALDIARGMEYVHSQGIIHRDLKPENVLVDEGFHLKIADFGTSCGASKCDSLRGTYRWMAPEMISGKRYGRKVDVYSFGLILWELVTGSLPFESMGPIQVAVAVADRNSRPIIPSDCPIVLRQLIQHCWAYQPAKRPEFSLVVKVLEQFDQSFSVHRY